MVLRLQKIEKILSSNGFECKNNGKENREYEANCAIDISKFGVDASFTRTEKTMTLNIQQERNLEKISRFKLDFEKDSTEFKSPTFVWSGMPGTRIRWNPRKDTTLNIKLTTNWESRNIADSVILQISTK